MRKAIREELICFNQNSIKSRTSSNSKSERSEKSIDIRTMSQYQAAYKFSDISENSNTDI